MERSWASAEYSTPFLQIAQVAPPTCVATFAATNVGFSPAARQGHSSSSIKAVRKITRLRILNPKSHLVVGPTAVNPTIRAASIRK